VLKETTHFSQTRKQELALVYFIFLPLAFLESWPSGICRCSTTNEKCLCDGGPALRCGIIFIQFSVTSWTRHVFLPSVSYREMFPVATWTLPPTPPPRYINKTAITHWCCVGRENVFSPLQVILTLHNLLYQNGCSLLIHFSYSTILMTSIGWDHLWTAATNGSIVHSTGHIWEWKTMVEWYWHGKLLIRQPELSGNTTSSHPVARQAELAKEIINFALRSISLILRRDL
jgi:hypothetical protein